MISQSESSLEHNPNTSQGFTLEYTYLTTSSPSRRLKRGLHKNKCKTYKSPCSEYLNFNKNRVLNHVYNCSNCSRLVNNQFLGTNMEQFPVQLHPSLSKQDHFQSQIDKIQNEMEKMKQQLRQNRQNTIPRHIILNDMEADELALHVYKRNKIEIQQIITKKMALVILDARKSKINIENNLMLFGEKVVNEIRKLHFQQCVQDCKSKLLLTHNQVMKSNFHIKTRQRYQSAFRFISKFTQIQLKTFSNLFQQYLKLTPTKKRYVRIYWQNIKKVNPFFTVFPSLPQLKSDKIQRLTFAPEITLQKASHRLTFLLRQGRLQLLCDIWLLLLMGLRFGDLLKVELYNENRQFYKLIKLTENKNKNIAVRYIPDSLSILCEYTQATYPVTPIRLRSAVKFCLQQFHCAYGFKHKVISYIVAVFNQQSAFGRFHKSSSTTSRFYIDKNCQILLNSVFKFPVKLTISEQKIRMIDNRTLLLDVSESNRKQTRIDENFQNEIIIEDGVNLQQRENLLNLDGIPSQSSDSNILQIKISQNHQLELSQASHQHLGSVILTIDNSASLLQQIQSQVSKEQQIFSNSSVLDSLSKLSNRQIHYYEQNQDSFSHRVYEPAIKSGQLQIVIAKTKENIYKVAQYSKRQQRYSKIQALNRFQAKNVDPYKSLCTSCKAKGTFSRLYTQLWKVKCALCDYQHSQQRDPKPFKTKIQIQWTGAKQHKFWSLTQVKNKQNNLDKTFNDHYPESLKQIHLYSSDFPQNIKIGLPLIGAKLQKELQKALKSEFQLPLRISNSTVINAGKGVFATERIGRNSLVCVYKCLIGTSYSINSQLDSNFTIGWTTDKDGNPIEILADGISSVGIGRFFNSKPENHANCRVLLGVTSSQIYIFFVTKEKIIEVGEELFIYYGTKYLFEGEASQKIQLEQSIESQQLDS